MGWLSFASAGSATLVAGAEAEERGERRAVRVAVGLDRSLLAVVEEAPATSTVASLKCVAATGVDVAARSRVDVRVDRERGSAVQPEALGEAGVRAEATDDEETEAGPFFAAAFFLFLLLSREEDSRPMVAMALLFGTSNFGNL